MAAITFVFPAVLYAAGAAAAPILIHLILRTKPRKIVFPALRFVRKTHRSTLKMLKLKHLLLLLMRMGAIALMAVLVARAFLPAWATREDRSVPTAAAIVIDNSGSMNYRYRGQSLLALAKQQARKLIESFPKGSRVAVMPTGGDRLANLLDPALAAQQVADLPATYGRAGVSAGLVQATELLRRSEQQLPRREVFLLTDLTAASWRDEAHLEGEKQVRYAIVKCGGEDLNAMLGDVTLSAVSAPVGSEVQVESSLAAANVGGDMVVDVELDGETVAQQSVKLPAGGTAPVAATVRPKREGIVHGRLVLKNADPLEMDNVRYFTLQVGPPAKVLILVGPTTVNQTGFLVGNAIAPSGPSAAGGIQRETLSADLLDAGRLKGVRVVLLADVAALTETQWRLLEPFVRGGGGLWVVAGPMMSASSYNAPAAQKLMPAALNVCEELADPQHWGKADLTHPMLKPFEGEDNPPLSDVQCRLRFQIASQAADAQAILQYQDKTPAILVRRLGDGTVVFWNFSPLPGFSNLGRLPQHPILAKRTAAELTAEPGAQTSYAYGQSITLPLPRSMPGAVVTCRPPGAKADLPLAPDYRRGLVTVPAEQLGSYDVRFAEAGNRIGRGFSVNAESAESDLRPMDASKLQAMFPEGLVICTDASELAERQATVTQKLDLSPLLLLALLALLTGESFFANRFYRRA